MSKIYHNLNYVLFMIHKHIYYKSVTWRILYLIKSIINRLRIPFLQPLVLNQIWQDNYNLALLIYEDKDLDYRVFKKKITKILKTKIEDQHFHLIHSLSAIHKNDLSFNSQCIQFNALPASIFRFDQWLSLCQIFGTLGHVELALTCRNNSSKSLKRISCPSHFETYSKMKFTLENNDYESFKIIRKTYSSKFVNLVPSIYIERIERLHKIINGELIINYESNYSSYLNGKKIAIVGPTVSGYDFGTEIDEFDVIIRTNFKKQENIHNWLGSKTNISYYNNQDIKRMIDEEDEYSISKLEWICYKSSLSPLLLSKIEFHNLRAIENFDDKLYNGTLNKIPNILLDVLSNSNPKAIKLFNINFQLNIDLYDSNYRITNNDKNDVVKEKFQQWSHDLFTQKHLIDTLYTNGLIDLDHISKSILKLSDIDYARQLYKD